MRVCAISYIAHCKVDTSIGKRLGCQPAEYFWVSVQSVWQGEQSRNEYKGDRAVFDLGNTYVWFK